MSWLVSLNIKGVIFLIVGAVFFILGVTNYFKGRNRKREWRLAEGAIVGPPEKYLRDAENPAYPVIEFKDLYGNLHTFKSDWTMSGVPKPGSKVQVLYDPKNPKNAIYHTRYSTYFIPIIFILAGIAFIRVAIYYLLDI